MSRLRPLPPQPALPPLMQAAVPMAGPPIQPAVGTLIRITRGRFAFRLGTCTGHVPAGIRVKLKDMNLILPAGFWETLR